MKYLRTSILVVALFLPTYSHGERYHETLVLTLAPAQRRLIAKLGDLNGDGVSDFAISEPDYDVSPGANNGRVSVYSGSNRSLLATLTGLTEQRLGTGLDGIGDTNNDGVPDILVGSRGRFVVSCTSTSVLTPTGRAGILSGANLSTWLVTVFGNPNGGFGIQATSPADLDGDGVKDFVVGAPWHYKNTDIFGNPNYCSTLGGAVFAFSGKSPGTLISSISVSSPGGTHLESIGDVNGDGIGDFAYLAYSPSKYEIVSGSSLASVSSIAVNQLSVDYGAVFRVLGDLTGDGIEEFAVAATSSTGGTVTVYEGSSTNAFSALATVAVEAGTNLPYGTGVDGIADLNGDGIRELLVQGSGPRGSIKIYSGASLVSGQPAVLTEHLVLGIGGSLQEIRTLGDLDGDGVEDFAASSNSEKVYLFLSNTPGTEYDPDPQDDDTFNIYPNLAVNL
jgi:hypothetical protein